MLILQIIAGLAILAATLWVFFAFNNHCETKFNYRFFTKKSFLIVGAAAITIALGNEWRLNSIQENGDVLNGILVMGIGSTVALFLAFINFKETNLIYGLGGTTVQMIVFGGLAYVGIFVLILGVVLSVMASLGTERVYVVNK